MAFQIPDFKSSMLKDETSRGGRGADGQTNVYHGLGATSSELWNTTHLNGGVAATARTTSKTGWSLERSPRVVVFAQHEDGE